MVVTPGIQFDEESTIASDIHHQNTIGQFFENSLEEYIIFQPHPFRVVAINRAARENLGYTIEQMNALSIADFMPEYNLDVLFSPASAIFNDQSDHISLSTLLRRSDGTLFPAEISLSILESDGQKNCLAQVNDLSKTTNMSNELQKKEAILRAVMDTAREAIVMIDDQAKVAFWNNAAEKMFGYSKDEIIGKSVRRLVTLDEQAYETYRSALKFFRSAQKGNVAGEKMELKTRRRDGSQVDIELSISALRINNSWHAIAIMHDISERVQSQRDIEESRQKYLELAENAPIGILSCDNQGNITYLNQCVLEILGSSSQEETYKINLLAFPLLIQHGFSEKLANSLNSGRAASFEMNYQSKWGKKAWIRIHIKPRVNGSKINGAQIIIDDISEQKQLEKKLRFLSITDTLTSAYNRRYFIQKLGEEIERARRLGSQFSLIMLDVDHYKNINDTYGHNSGDRILKSITVEMSKNIRSIDTLARWGGDEFVILLPGTQVDDAAVIADRLRERISQQEFSEVGVVTASFGVVNYTPGDTVEKLLRNVDVALYNAKDSGRNCVQYIPPITIEMEC